VLSIAASVTPSSASQAAIWRSDRQNVLNLFAVTVRSPGRCPGSRHPDDLLVHIDPGDPRMDDLHR
jgi:hypothetical protein